MNLKIFSPIDGTVGKIEELQDGIFSNKMLGDGFFIRSDKKTDSVTFYSPIEKGTVQFVADTKHAVFFDLGGGLNILMHIGLDSVKLNGEPFSNVIKLESEVDVNSKIVDVNINLINNAGLDDVCPITINSEKEAYEFKMLTKNKNVKKGDLIGEFTLVTEKKVEEKLDINNNEFLSNYFSSEDIYTRIAKKINTFVGMQKNYNEVYNCMTRLRFKIKDKSIVKVEDIKKLDLVKGIVWNGNELQVVIGQDVYKLKEAVSNINESEVIGNFELAAKANTKKMSFGRKFLMTFSGIMIPCIPVFIGSGLVSAITGVLMWAKVMPNMSWVGETAGSVGFADVAWYWIVLFVIGKSATMFIGITVAVSASKYFGLRTTVGCAIGVILCSPALFLQGGTTGLGGKWTIVTFHTFTDSEISDLTLRTFVNSFCKLTICCASIKIFIVIPTIYMAKRIDDWLLKVINPMFELTFRSFLTIFLASLLGLIIIMPIWNCLEALFSIAFVYIGKLPFGIGVGLYTAMWQIAVSVGLHMALGMIGVVQGIAQADTGSYGIFGAGSSISVYSQLGAMVALMIVTKNSALKNECKGLLILPILGITEPILYGITMPRKKTFWAAILGAFVAGCALGIFNVTGRLSTGIGIFEAIGFFNYTSIDPTGAKGLANGQLTQLANGLYYVLCAFIAFGCGLGFSLLMSQKRKMEKKSIKTNTVLIKNLIKYNLILNNVNKDEIKNILSKSDENLKQIESILTKEDIIAIKSVEKDIIKLNKLETKLSNIIRSETNQKDKLNKKGRKLVDAEKFDKAKSVLLKINSINNEEKINELKEKISLIKPDYALVDQLITKKLNEINVLIKNQQNICDLPFLKDGLIINNFFNSLNEMRFEYKIIDPKNAYDFSEEIVKLKNDIKEEKNLIKHV